MDTTASSDGGDHMRRRDVLCAVALAFTAEWSVADGSAVDQRQVVGTIGAIERGNLQQVTAPARGSLRILSRDKVETLIAHAKGEAIDGEAVGGIANGNGNGHAMKPSAAETVPIAYVEYCIHPLLNGRTCMMCLAVVDENEEELDDERKSVNVVSHGQILRLNVEEAKKFDSANMKRQLEKQKLSLVLDLDHTLLHAVRVEDLTSEIAKADDIHYFFIPGLPSQHVVKLRPGLTAFLEELSATYDLFIYTHGTRTYAEEIAKIIDPNGTFFQHRIVARTDTPDMLHKSLKLLFPSCDDSMILVLDDRIDVWKDNESNVFLIKPYHYFNSTREINNASGNVFWFEDDATLDDHLDNAKRVLTEVHKAFYGQGSKAIAVEDQMSGKGSDVKRILVEHKKTVLAGCNIVFSGLFPLHGARKPQNERLWRLAVRLGATVSLTMDNFPMTHLVIHPGRLDTAKHNQAKTMSGVVVVVPEWMQKSEQIWKRAPESEFLADTWSAKLARHEADKKAAAEAAAVARVVPPSNTEGQNALGETTPTESTVNRDDGTEEKSGGGDDMAAVPFNAPTAPTSSKPPPVSILMKESRVVTVGDTDMDKERLPDTEKKKAVTFSAEVDEAEAQRARELAAQEASVSAEANGFLRSSRGSANGPRRPLRRIIGGRSIPLSARPPPENKGLVASGGTFDFLSKISQLGANKRDQKPSASTSPAPSVTTVVSSNPPPTVAAKEPIKDIDDAFLRLIEAEEEETAHEQKRKRSSSSLKDELANRRLKREKTEASARPPPVPAQLPASADTPTDVDDEEEAEDGDLDDLEADILDAL